MIFEKYALEYFKSGMKVLEIGRDIPSSYEKLVNNSFIVWHTADIDSNQKDNLTYVMENPYSIPVPTGTYDVVLSGQVIEHVPKNWIWMREVARTIRKGGS